MSLTSKAVGAWVDDSEKECSTLDLRGRWANCLGEPAFEDAFSAACTYALQLQHLRTLRLAQNQLGDGSVGPLCRYMELLNLTELDLSYNLLGPIGAERVARSFLQKKDGAEEATLDMSHNPLKDRGVLKLADPIIHAGAVLLRIRSVGATSRCIQAFEHCKNSLVELDISDNEIESDGVILLTRVVKAAGNLRTLQLDAVIRQSRSRLGIACTALLRCLADSPPCLKRVTFGSNGLDDGSSAQVAEQLFQKDQMNILEHFSLKRSGFSIASSAALAHVLEEGFKLRSIEVSHNRLDDECARLLSEGFAGNPYLSKLDVANNQITELGAKHLASGLEKQLKADFSSFRLRPDESRCLIELDLSTNPICDAGVNEFATVLMLSFQGKRWAKGDAEKMSPFAMPWGLEKLHLRNPEAMRIGRRGRETLLGVLVQRYSAMQMVLSHTGVVPNSLRMPQGLTIEGIDMPPEATIFLDLIKQQAATLKGGFVENKAQHANATPLGKCNRATVIAGVSKDIETSNEIKQIGRLRDQRWSGQLCIPECENVEDLLDNKENTLGVSKLAKEADHDIRFDMAGDVAKT